MKANFYGYYSPSTEQYNQLWNDGLIVLDTNVLLNLYRLPTAARDELISVLELLKERLWIPHQVALEFQHRRLSVIAYERKATEDALTATSDLVSDIKKKVDTLQIDKRGLGIQSEPLLTELERANNQLLEAIKTTHSAQLDISSSDLVRERLDALLEGRVGPAPSSQSDLDALVVNGEERFTDKIPPGFADADKGKNPNDATFIFDHIKYQRKFGDLILWRQLIEHVKKTDTKTVLLITADRKEDWWWREQGKTIGPHHELVREIKREGAVDLFWMYTSVQFIEQATKYTTASVSKESVAEIKQVAHSSSSTLVNSKVFLEGDHLAFSTNQIENSNIFRSKQSTELDVIEDHIYDWLTRYGEPVERNQRGFPDFLVRNNDDDVHGYDVKHLRQWQRALTSANVVNSIMKGYIEKTDGVLSRFSLIIAISADEILDFTESNQTDLIVRRFTRLLKQYPIDSIIIGGVINDLFEVIFQINGN